MYSLTSGCASTKALTKVSRSSEMPWFVGKILFRKASHSVSAQVCVNPSRSEYYVQAKTSKKIISEKLFKPVDMNYLYACNTYVFASALLSIIGEPQLFHQNGQKHQKRPN